MISTNKALPAVNNNLKQCNVKNDQVLFEGVQKAMEAIQELRANIKVDSVNFIQAADQKDRCEFAFDLFRENILSEIIYLGRAEIILSKNNWEPISRGIYEGNNKLTW